MTKSSLIHLCEFRGLKKSTSKTEGEIFTEEYVAKNIVFRFDPDDSVRVKIKYKESELVLDMRRLAYELTTTGFKLYFLDDSASFRFEVRGNL